MNEEEKVMFLRRMGYHGSAMKAYLNKDKIPERIIPNKLEGHWRQKKPVDKEKRGYIDKSDLLELDRLINPPKQEVTGEQ